MKKTKQKKILAIAGFVLMLAIALAISFHVNAQAQEHKEGLNVSNLQGLLQNITQYRADMRQIHCYCGCDHTDLYNCYEEGMLTNCGTCMGEYKDYLSLRNTMPIQEISQIINDRYKNTVPDND